MKRVILFVLAAFVASLVPFIAAHAGTTVSYAGNGFTYDGTTYNLNDERCGLTGQNDANDGGTGQFANWNGIGQAYETGQGYLVWVLTANGATSATLTLPGTDNVVNMIKVGGTFKYASQYYNYADLIGPPVVIAEYAGKVKGNVNLVVSHGCQPMETEGAWCSPGFWKKPGKVGDPFDKTPYSRTSLFNETVVPDYYGKPAESPEGTLADPTLQEVLDGSANTYGKAFDPLGLNPFNATGAMLTDSLEGFEFDPELIGAENACPLDNDGNWK